MWITLVSAFVECCFAIYQNPDTVIYCEHLLLKRKKEQQKGGKNKIGICPSEERSEEKETGALFSPAF